MQAWQAARKHLPGSLPDLTIKLALRSVIDRNPGLDETVWIGAVGGAIEAEVRSINKGGWINEAVWVAAAKALAPGSAPTPGDTASNSAKTKTVTGAVGKDMPMAKKARQEATALKKAKREAVKSEVDPVVAGALKSEVGLALSPQKPTDPKQTKLTHQPQPGNTPAPGPEVASTSAPKPMKLKPGAKLFTNDPGVPLAAASSDPEIDFGGFAPPGDLPVGIVDGEVVAQTIPGQAKGPAHASPMPLPEGLSEAPIRLTVIREGTKQDVGFTASDLSDDAIFNNLLNTCSSLSTPVTFKAIKLLDWPDQQRWKLLNLLEAIGSHAKIQLDDGEPRSDVFEAALGAMDVDVERCTHGRRFAQEAAALFRSDMVDIASSRIAKRLKELKIGGIRVATIVKEVRTLVDALAQQPKHDKLVAVVTQVASAPVAANIMVPPNWELTGQGIFRPGLTETLIAPAPVVITSLMEDMNDGTESLELAWKKGDGWVRKVVERHNAADSHSVVKLAAWGAPVTSNNAKAFVQFIADFEATNLPHLPRRRVTPRMGWPANGSFKSFLCGNVDLVENDPAKPVDTTATADGVSFRGGDEGEEQLAQGFRAAGTYEGWRAATKILEEAYPRVGLALYASLTPPLLAVVDAANFIVDYAGVTSQGKTTTLRLAASLWGDPNERNAASALSTWHSTRTWVERATAVLNSLPLILDDTKTAKSPAEIATTLYDVANGRGKNRGTAKGLARAGTWSTVLISSGEAPISSFTEDGGTRARVLPIWGSPFGAADAATAKVVRTLDAGVKANFGHIGPRFVRYLVDNRGSWPTWRTWYQEIVDEYMEKAGNNPVAGRMAGHIAALELTASLVMEAFDNLCWTSKDQFNAFWTELTTEAPEADPVRRAMRHAFDWATGHQTEFFGRHETHSGHVHHPTGGWAGRWDEPPHWTYLGFLPHRLKEVLTAGGFEFEPTVRNWRDRGWLLTNGGSKTKFRAQIGGEVTELPWLIALKHEAITGLDAEVST